MASEKDADAGGRGSFLDRKISRREFLQKAAVGVAGLGLGYYLLDEWLLKDLVPSQQQPAVNETAPKSLWKWSKEARYYTRYGDGVRCMLCPNHCILSENGRGICRTRVNKDNKLYTLSYGNPCAIHVDPIEKKPFFHFLPGTKAFSLATAGCNLRCKYCQNWDISQTEPEKTQNYDLMPDATVDAALDAKSKDSLVKSIAYTYSEPVAFYDYVLDTSKSARSRGLKSVVITSGYMNPDPAGELAENVDAVKIDLKGFNSDFYRNVCAAELDRVLDAIKVFSKQKVWMEIVNLVVPTLNDNLDEVKAMCEWLKENAGEDVPLHFSRFHPDYQLRNLPPTPTDTLLKAREIALDAGLNFVYVGNVPHGDYENTYCPKCNAIAIERIGYIIKQDNIIDGRCGSCGAKIAGVWS